MPANTRSSDCPQYGISTARTLTITAFPGHPGRCWPFARWRSLARIGTRVRPSPVDVSEDEVQAGEDGDDVGDVHAAQHPGRDGDVVEAGRGDLHPERAEVASGHDVVAHLAERVLRG